VVGVARAPTAAVVTGRTAMIRHFIVSGLILDNRHVLLVRHLKSDTTLG
jgi:hypothetical protein